MENLSLPTRQNYVHGVLSALFIFIFTAAVFADHYGLLSDNPYKLPSASIFSNKYDAISSLKIVGGDIIINEVDSDSPGADNLEFVELHDGGVGNTPLDGYVVVFFNGSTDLSYRAIDLDGFSTNANGYFTLGNAAVPGVDVTFPNDGLQNGQDAVAIYSANASNFPNNTPVTTTNLIDALVYDNGQADDPGLLVLLNPAQPQINENGSMSGQTASMQRCPNGSGGTRNTTTYSVFTPTPDGNNVCGAPELPIITLSASTYLQDESQTMVVTVQRSGSGTSSVQYSTAGGSATPAACSLGGDYEAQNGTLSFTGSQTSATVSIPICSDVFRELAETFNLALSAPVNATLGSPTTAVATINDTAAQFSNTAPIVINEGGSATPYPSTITVAGGPSSVHVVRVTLFDVASDRADDLDVLLVGPGGQSIVLMADAGGAGPLSAETTITFSDDAVNFLPDASLIAPGTYKPSSWEEIPTTFPVPAPVGPHAEPGPGGMPPRSVFMNTVFGGTNANGIWSLYVFDDTAGPVSALAPGSIAGGWGLEMLAPTAAAVSLSGRVIDASGRGIRNAVLTLESGGPPGIRFGVTGSLGHYQFDGLATGVYLLTVNSARYTFLVRSRTIALTDNVADADFVAEPRE